MKETITVTGMVLSASPVGEYDRRIVLLTKERGKIAAFARGARKPNGSALLAVNPFSFGTFTLYENRTSYNMMQADIENYFSDLRTDVEAAYYGFYFMDLAGYYAREANDETELLKLLYQTMRALTSKKIPNRLIRYIFELKIVTVNGEGPQVFECVRCGASDREVIFSPRMGGLVCRECMAEVRDGITLDNSTLYALQYIVSSPIEKLFTFLLTDEVLNRLGRTIEKYLEQHLDKRFKSLEILEMLIDHG